VRRGFGCWWYRPVKVRMLRSIQSVLCNGLRARAYEIHYLAKRMYFQCNYTN
jgi:hypothetical protein